MSMKIMGLAFVVIISGCHAPPQGAVCPSSTEEAVEEEIRQLKANMSEQERKEFDAELEEGRERMRRTRSQD